MHVSALRLGWMQADGKWCCATCQSQPSQAPWAAPKVAHVDIENVGTVVHERGCTLARTHKGKCDTRRSLAMRPRADDGEDYMTGGSGRRGGRGRE